jgi:soluble lytic murein transglycosylase-like protein
MESNSAQCLSLSLFIALSLQWQLAFSAPGDIYLTRQNDGTPFFSNAPGGSGSYLIESTPSSPRHPSLQAIAKPFNERWNGVVREIAARHHVDPALVQAVIDVESHFDPEARSAKGAAGMMQLMPQTATRYGVKDAFDAYQNIEAGVRHLKALLDSCHGNVVLALAAYNAGERAVITQHGLIPPYRETMLYVPKVLARYQAYRAMSLERESIR